MRYLIFILLFISSICSAQISDANRVSLRDGLQRCKVAGVPIQNCFTTTDAFGRMIYIDSVTMRALLNIGSLDTALINAGDSLIIRHINGDSTVYFATGGTDHDWYESGATPPNSISDEMYHTGDVHLGYSTMVLGGKFNIKTEAADGVQSTIVARSEPTAALGQNMLLDFEVNSTALTGSAGFTGLNINRVGTQAVGTSYFFRMQDAGTEVFSLNAQSGELLLKPITASGFSAFQYDATNTSNIGFFRATNSQNGVEFRNALPTDDGTGGGFRFSTTTNTAYSPLTDLDARVLIVGNGHFGSGLDTDVFSVTAGGVTKITGDGGTAVTMTGRDASDNVTNFSEGGTMNFASGVLDADTINWIATKFDLDGISAGSLPDGDYGDITVTSLVMDIDPGVIGDAELGIGINTNQFADGSVSSTEFEYINTLSSNAQTQINLKANDADVVHDTGNENVAGIKTFTDDPIVPAESYDATNWNGSNEIPTKNDIRDKIETMDADPSDDLTTATVLSGQVDGVYNSTVIDIDNLTNENAPHVLNDKIPFYDASTTANRSMTMEEMFAEYERSWRKYRFSYYNEFISHVNADVVGRDLFASNTGTSASSDNVWATSAPNVIGVVRSTTGTTATGRAAVVCSMTSFRLGGGSWTYEIRIDSINALSSGTQRYQLWFGFFDNVSSTAQTDGAYFLYDEGGVSAGSAASANWQTVTASNGSRTFNTSSTAVVNTQTTLRIEVNAAASTVEFYINGTKTATDHSANIPKGNGRELGFGWTILKSIGTTPALVGIDWIAAECDYTTAKP